MSHMDRVRNEEIRRRLEWRGSWQVELTRECSAGFGHVERIDEQRMAKKLMMAPVSGGRLWRRPRFGWMDGWRKGYLEYLANH